MIRCQRQEFADLMCPRCIQRSTSAGLKSACPGHLITLCEHMPSPSVWDDDQSSCVSWSVGE